MEVTREAHGGRARSSGRGFISHVHRASPRPAAGRHPGKGLFSGELWGGSGWLPRWCKPHGAIYTHCKTCRGKGREKLLKKRGFAGTVLCLLSYSPWRRCGVLNRGSRQRLEVSPAPSSLTGGVSGAIFPDRACEEGTFWRKAWLPASFQDSHLSVFCMFFRWFPVVLTGVLPPEQSSCWESDFRLVWRAWGCRSLKGTAFRGVVQSVSTVQYGFMPARHGERSQLLLLVSGISARSSNMVNFT